jgi:hypothetical protein
VTAASCTSVWVVAISAEAISERLLPRFPTCSLWRKVSLGSVTEAGVEPASVAQASNLPVSISSVLRTPKQPPYQWRREVTGLQQPAGDRRQPCRAGRRAGRGDRCGRTLWPPQDQQPTAAAYPISSRRRGSRYYGDAGPCERANTNEIQPFLSQPPPKWPMHLSDRGAARTHVIVASMWQSATELRRAAELPSYLVLAMS